jgi:hypothetical protein
VSDVCIIGGGSSGVTTGKALLERGVSFDILEKGSNLGGMWRYQNDSGTSSAYRSLHIDTSRKSLAYSDFPISSDLPDYLSHSQVLAYLTAYAGHFKVTPHIQFGSTVSRVSPVDGSWLVELASGEKRTYRAVIVANGHLTVPRQADFPGRFDGEQLHSHHYRTATPFEGKRVLVIGIGNSGVDIAVDVCRQAQSVVLSTRRGAWLMPKYIFGIPTDRWSGFFTRKLKLPTPWARALVHKLAYLSIGDQERFGIPKPEHPIWREHACVSQDLLSCIGHGWISVKRNVKELRGASVLFEDGAELPFDVIIHATGYKTTFPFLDPAIFEVRDNDVALYKRIVSPGYPGLFFAGLVQPVGPTVPLVEVQGRWIAAVCAGAVKLPSKSVMLGEIAEHQGRLRQRYVDSPRYTLEVDFREHAQQLRADL